MKIVSVAVAVMLALGVSVPSALQRQGREATITQCRLGYATVPNVLGMVEATARPVLEGAGFKNLVFGYTKGGLVEPPYDTYVIRVQNPAAGSYVLKCTELHMILGE